MSLRNLRKMVGGNTIPKVDENSDEEYEPLYTKHSPSKFRYDGLVLSSNSEPEESAQSAGEPEAEPQKPSKSSKKNNRKKRNRKAKQAEDKKDGDKSHQELDEVERAVREVELECGAAPPPKPPSPPPDPVQQILAVCSKHLHVANELLRVFGPDEDEPKKRGRPPPNLLRKGTIVPIQSYMKVPRYEAGLSMSILRRDKGDTYFIFDHSEEYQKMHRTYLRHSMGPLHVESAQEALMRRHVESMLESADNMYLVEGYEAANTVVEQAIAFMQYVSHHMFNVTSRNVRLEFKYYENRTFHIAVLKYAYAVSNRACHRTALELAKMLLQLDPSDPLAILFVIDTFALRAREHQWLTEAVAHWTDERDASCLFNIQYSNALAYYHVAKKNKADRSSATVMLEHCLLRWPLTGVKLLQYANGPVPDCPLFKNADQATAKTMKQLTEMYVHLCGDRWREPPIRAWLTETCRRLAEKYIAQPELKEISDKFEKLWNTMFRGLPPQILRHLAIIRPMSELLFDNASAVPMVMWPPTAAPELNRYNYESDRPLPFALRMQTEQGGIRQFGEDPRLRGGRGPMNPRNQPHDY